MVRISSGAVDRATGKEEGGENTQAAGMERNLSQTSSDVERVVTAEAALRSFLRQKGSLREEESWVVSRKAKGFLRFWLQAEEEEREAACLAKRLRGGSKGSVSMAGNGSASKVDVNGSGRSTGERRGRTGVMSSEEAGNGIVGTDA